MLNKIKRVNEMFFSPTGTTKNVVNLISKEISDYYNIVGVKTIDFTLPDVRNDAVSFNSEDLMIIGVPVYAGRVPNVLLKYLSLLKGNGALAVAVVLYGNRNYDDALIELNDILCEVGFVVVAAGSFVGEHSFSKVLAKDRPDIYDLNIAKDFAQNICSKIEKADDLKLLSVKGNRPYRNYYKPKDENNNLVDIRKVTPKTSGNCIDCKLCVKICPMGSIDYSNVEQFNGICIKCGACIKNCPVEAKFYDDENYLKHKKELEEEFTCRREPELFL